MTDRARAETQSRETTMTNEDVVRAACQVIWTDGEVDRIGEFYADDFRADYPITNWGEGLAGARALLFEPGA